LKRHGVIPVVFLISPLPSFLTIGHYRGLAFGLVLHPNGGADVFLEGAATRHGMLSRDHRGPRAVLNALDRLPDSYPGQCDATAADLAIAEGQRRDHQARLGRPFLHDDYLRNLTDLRDLLKAGLSQATPEPGTLPVAEIADRIKALKAAHTIDDAPERTVARHIAAEEPVTARIRRRAESAPVTLPPVEHEAPGKAHRRAAVLERQTLNTVVTGRFSLKYVSCACIIPTLSDYLESRNRPKQHGHTN
jgi:hypothetical protein